MLPFQESTTKRKVKKKIYFTKIFFSHYFNFWKLQILFENDMCYTDTYPVSVSNKLTWESPIWNLKESVKTQNSFVSKEDWFTVCYGKTPTVDLVGEQVTWDLQTVWTDFFQLTRGQNICNIVTALIMIHSFCVLYNFFWALSKTF